MEERTNNIFMHIESGLEKQKDFTLPEVLYEELIRIIREYHPSDDISLIEKAYKLSYEAHRNKKESRVNLI